MLKRKRISKYIICACLVVVLVMTFALNTFAFYNPGYDEESEVFPGTPVIPHYSNVNIIRNDLDNDAYELLLTQGYQEWYNKAQTGFIIVEQDFEYYQEQLLGPDFQYYLGLTLEATTLGGVGNSARILVEPMKAHYLKPDGTISELMNVGWSFQFDFTARECIISEAYGGTVLPITVNTLRVPCSISTYEDTSGNIVYTASLDVRFLLNGEAERVTLYTREGGDYFSRGTIRNARGGNGNIWLTRYLVYDRIFGTQGDHLFVSDIRIGDNLDGQYFFDQGFSEGYAEGFGDGSDEGYAQGLDDGFDEGYAEGSSDGYLEGALTQGAVVDVPAVVNSYFSGVRAMLDGAFDFELFGINVAGLIIILLCLTIVGFIIKRIV